RLIVLWGLKERLRRNSELGPHEKCEDTRQEGEIERRHQVENTDFLMVGCEEPSFQPDRIQSIPSLSHEYLRDQESEPVSIQLIELYPTSCRPASVARGHAGRQQLVSSGCADCPSC